MKKLLSAACCTVIILCISCVPHADGKSEIAVNSEKTLSLHVVNWNVQTFFDATTDGTEYSEYKSTKSNWGRNAYMARLERLCDVIKKLNADVYVFEEIENEGIMYDIANTLAGNAWNRKNWCYACFAKIPGDALGCAVLSRYELGAMATHALDIRVHGKQPSMRPVIEVAVFVDGKPLTIFVNHWKSKLGGEVETEIWRDWQESVMAGKIRNLNNRAAITCGDFNRDIAEFAPGLENDAILFRGAHFGKTHEQTLRSPWLWNSMHDSYSYYYEGSGERIDHFFVSGAAEILSFSAEVHGAWADGNGMPLRYVMYTGKGYSDHLPISAIIAY
ncbi:MAG: endonuclease/exonuclease/phosphatase family protein [Treponema sp.]|nr:endonuclease/exonuclease/phosphatase family protein [Treponema sp.]